MKKFFSFACALTLALGMHAQTKIAVTVGTKEYQNITGFGAADCDGAMKPFGDDTAPVRLLYGPTSAVELNIMRMEMSPNLKDGDVWGDYDWNGGVPSARLVKKYGGIVFATPWSPPGEFKTNGTAQGGNDESKPESQRQKGKLRDDCYEKLFPWFNTFLKYMKSKSVNVDIVSIQNEPDWWVNYSGCLYEPQDQVRLIRDYAHLLDRETFKGLRLMSAEPLGYRNDYYTALYNDATCRKEVNIIAGHIYGHAPLDYIAPVSQKAHDLGMEVWQTENSVSDGIQGRLPNWDEQLDFARTVHECLLAGCNAYVYWYMRAHWAFVGTGESKYGTDNKKNKLLPRAYVMAHYSKNITGATRLKCVASGYTTPKTGDKFQASTYIKGDSLIVHVIESAGKDYNMILSLPYKVKGGVQYTSTGNQTENLYQKSDIEMEEAADKFTMPIKKKSVTTFIFNIEREETVIDNPVAVKGEKMYYDMQGRRIAEPKGMYIERSADGTVRKVLKGSEE